MHSGTLGSVLYGGTAGTLIEGLKTWSLDVGAAELDASAFGSSWKRTESGIKEWSGSIEGNAEAGGQQSALWGALSGGSKVELSFFMGGTAQYYRGTAVITGSGPSQSFDGQGGESFKFKGDGPLVRVG